MVSKYNLAIESGLGLGLERDLCCETKTLTQGLETKTLKTGLETTRLHVAHKNLVPLIPTEEVEEEKPRGSQLIQVHL